MKVRPSVIILEKDGILVMQYNYGGNTVYALPGGNPDRLETLDQALVRELREELKIDIEIIKLALVGEVVLPEIADSTLHCVFFARIVSGCPELDPRHTKALGCQWLKISEVSAVNLYPNVGMEIDKFYQENFAPDDTYIGKIGQHWFK